MATKAMSGVRLWVVMTAIILAFGCALRTTHKVETTHKIDAHIVIDIRRIEDDMRDIEDMVEGGETKSEGRKSSNRGGARLIESSKRSLLASFFSLSAAEAAEAGNPSDEMVRAVESRKKRLPELRKYKSEGCVGENNQGLLELRRTEKTRSVPAYRKKVVDLVKAENKDREIIYKEYLKKKGLPPEAIARVKASAAKTHREKAKKGEWIQLPVDPKEIADLKASKLGKLLGKTIEPGKWCQVP